MKYTVLGHGRLLKNVFDRVTLRRPSQNKMLKCAFAQHFQQDSWKKSPSPGEVATISKQASAIKLLSVTFADAAVPKEGSGNLTTKAVVLTASAQEDPAPEDETAILQQRGFSSETIAPLTSTRIEEDDTNSSSPGASIPAVSPPAVSSVDSVGDEQSVPSPSPQSASPPAASSGLPQTSSKQPRPSRARSVEKRRRSSPPVVPPRKPAPEAPHNVIILPSSRSAPGPPPSPARRSPRAHSSVSVSDRRRAPSSSSTKYGKLPGSKATSSSHRPPQREPLASSHTSGSSGEVVDSRSAKDPLEDVSVVGDCPKGSRSVIGGRVSGQYSGNRSRISGPFSPKPPARPKSRRSFKSNGRCVYKSGFPSMVGERIESASEDEEFWERTRPVTMPIERHGKRDDG